MKTDDAINLGDWRKLRFKAINPHKPARVISMVEVYSLQSGGTWFDQNLQKREFIAASFFPTDGSCFRLVSTVFKPIFLANPPARFLPGPIRIWGAQLGTFLATGLFTGEYTRNPPAELQGMAALLQRLYEIALSHMTEGEQLELEREQIEWAEGMIADCPADGLLEEILADSERAREPVRCLADNLYERIGALDTLLNNLR